MKIVEYGHEIRNIQFDMEIITTNDYFEMEGLFVEVNVVNNTNEILYQLQDLSF